VSKSEKRPPIIMPFLPDGTSIKKAWAIYQKLVVQEQRNRARAEKMGCYVEAVNFPMNIVRWNGCCCICGEPVDLNKGGNLPTGLTLEHIISLGQGGRHVDNNIGPAHRDCNVAKSRKIDTPKAAKVKRMAGITGQYARRSRAKAAGKHKQIQHPGFSKTLRRKMNGKTVRRET